MTDSKLASLGRALVAMSLMMGGCDPIDEPPAEPDTDTTTAGEESTDTGEESQEPAITTTTTTTTGQETEEPTTTGAEPMVPLGCEGVEPAGEMGFETDHGVFMDAVDFEDQEYLEWLAGGPVPPEAQVMVLASDAELACFRPVTEDQIWCYPGGFAVYDIFLFPVGPSEGTFTDADVFHYGLDYLGDGECGNGGGGERWFNGLELVSVGEHCITGHWAGSAFMAGDTPSPECG